MKNGPAIITANKDIELSAGQETHNSKKFAICRCGRSFNKLLCDGSHKNYKWEDEA